MSEREEFLANLGKLSEVAKANVHLPEPEQRITTLPKKTRKKRTTKRDGREIVNEALGANNGGDYADEDDVEPDSMPEPATPFYEYDQAKAAALALPPVAFVEPRPIAYLTDYADELLPAPGFVTDFVNTSRGMEVPTLFMLWGALGAVSSILARHAWLQWYPEKLWPNLYTVLVALPGLCTKSTALNMQRKLVQAVPELLPSNIEEFEKTLPIMTGKATSDGILGALAPEERIFVVPETNSLKFVKRGSKAVFNISELTTFMNKQQYNASLISTMTALYDCQDEDSELTRARGKEPLRDIYVTFTAGTTPDHLKTSIPEEALGGGFMSRTVVVYQDIPAKIYPIPLQLEGYPSPDDIAPRLAWIAHNAKGEYYLSKEALMLYSLEYRNWKQRLIDNVSSETAGETRYAIILLKVAMLLRVQEYRLGNEISEQNVRDAIRILSFTQSNSKSVTDDIGLNDYTRWLNAFKRIVARKGTVQRSWVQARLSAKGCRVEQLDSIIHQLATEDYIVIECNGQRLLHSSSTGKETYSLTPRALREYEEGQKDGSDKDD